VIVSLSNWTFCIFAKLDHKSERRRETLLEIFFRSLFFSFFSFSKVFLGLYWECWTCLLVVDALQNIWVNWSKTPNLSDNLPGWSSEETDTSSIYPCQSLSNAKAKQSCSLYNGVVSKYPCQNLSNPDVTIPNWRGVFCFKTNYDEKSGNSTILVNGL
jgi:hypothetical protein